MKPRVVEMIRSQIFHDVHWCQHLYQNTKAHLKMYIGDGLLLLL